MSHKKEGGRGFSSLKDGIDITDKMTQRLHKKEEINIDYIDQKKHKQHKN